MGTFHRNQSDKEWYMTTLARRMTRLQGFAKLGFFLSVVALGGSSARAVIVGPYPNGVCVNTATGDVFVCVGPPPLATCHDPATGITSACGGGSVSGPGLPFPDPNYAVPPSQYVPPGQYMPGSTSQGNGSPGSGQPQTAVPEPGWCVLMTAGGLPLGVKALRRRWLMSFDRQKAQGR